MPKVNIADKLSSFEDIYVPKIVGELNGQYVKLVRFKGPYVMHNHELEDEMFLVLKGSFAMRYPDREEVINEGEFVIIPAGEDHCPVADEECHIMLFEPKTVTNTGKAGSEYTIAPDNLETI